MNLLRYLFFPWWRQRFLVEIRFKSGNTFRGWFWKMKTKYEGEKLVGLEWNSVGHTNNMQFIGLDQVEHIASVKSRGFLSSEA